MKTMFVVALFLLSLHPALAQTSPQLTITTSQHGSIAPGTSLSLTVSPPPGTFMKAVMLRSDLITSSTFSTNPPFTFAILIPSDASVGAHDIWATGRTTDGRLLISERLSITVDRADDPTSLRVAGSPKRVLTYRGEQLRLDLYATYAGGTVKSIDDSSRLSCLSSHGSIFVIVPPCSVVAVGPGTGSLTVRLGATSTTLPVIVNLNTRGDFEGDGDIDLHDVNWLTAYRGQTAAFTGDDRDLNSDGKIDALDARVLTTMCTRPRCAVQ